MTYTEYGLWPVTRPSYGCAPLRRPRIRPQCFSCTPPPRGVGSRNRGRGLRVLWPQDPACAAPHRMHRTMKLSSLLFRTRRKGGFWPLVELLDLVDYVE